MKLYLNGLAFVAAGLFLAGTLPASAFAAEDQKDPPNGSIAALLRLRDKLPLGPAPPVSEVQMADGAVEVTRQVTTQAFRAETVTVVQPDGRPVQVTRTVAVPVVQYVKERVEAKTIKPFVVTKDGKLEALDAAKLPEMLKKPTHVLLGHSAELDPRHLELIKPGTFYLALPARLNVPIPQPLPPAEKP